MRLTIIGGGSGASTSDEPKSGYLLTEGEAALLLDCGWGVATSLPRYVPLNRLAGIVISHMHLDNYYDLLPLAVALNRISVDTFMYKHAILSPPATGKVPVYLPPGGTERLARVIAAVSEGLSSLAFALQWIVLREYDQTRPLAVGPFTVRAFGPLVHGTGSGFGLRVTADEVTVGYSGESGWCDALLDVARDTDLFLCEAHRITSRVRTDHDEFHLSADEAGRIAFQAGARQLVLTHFANASRAWTNAMIEEARAHYDGAIGIARKGTVFDLSP